MVAQGRKPCKAVSQNKMPILRELGGGTARSADFCKQQFRMLYNGGRPVGVVLWALAD
jgi:hypothetical protein